MPWGSNYLNEIKPLFLTQGFKNLSCFVFYVFILLFRLNRRLQFRVNCKAISTYSELWRLFPANCTIPVNMLMSSTGLGRMHAKSFYSLTRYLAIVAHALIHVVVRHHASETSLSAHVLSQMCRCFRTYFFWKLGLRIWECQIEN